MKWRKSLESQLPFLLTLSLAFLLSVGGSPTVPRFLTSPQDLIKKYFHYEDCICAVCFSL